MGAWVSVYLQKGEACKLLCAKEGTNENDVHLQERRRSCVGCSDAVRNDARDTFDVRVRVDVVEGHVVEQHGGFLVAVRVQPFRE